MRTVISSRPSVTSEENDNLRVILSSDHAGVEIRKLIFQRLQDEGWQCNDIGPESLESVDYPVFGRAAAEKVATGECRFGVIFCGTGQGIMMAANKVTGIRCGVCSDVLSARLIRAHNDANMLSLGARLITAELAWEVVEAFLTTKFDRGRHLRRVNMIEGVPRGQN